MECKNHPGVAAVDRCAGCAETFCQNCLVDIQGRKYCGQCKVLAIQGQAPPPMPGYGQQTCPQAKEALITAIISLFCCAIILGPWALVKANEAKKKIDANPYLTGRGMATAAQVIAVVGLILWGLGLLLRFAEIQNM